MNIILATANSHKKRELSRILSEHTLLLPAEAGFEGVFDFEETEETFLGNSVGKAAALFSLCGSPVLADDSGLVVPALGGEPGVYSARYGSKPGGNKLSDSDRNRFLLDKMRAVSDREAFFVCCMTLMLDAYRVFTFQETLHGLIGTAPSGSGGFGYDPLFFLPEFGRTAAELSEDEKNAVSHRGRAGRRVNALLDHMTEEENRRNQNHE